MKLNENVEMYLGDCLELVKNIPDKSIDLILCDLPYGKLTDKTRAKWDNLNYEDLCIQYRRIIKNNGVIILHGNEPFSSMIRMLMIDLYKYDLKWIKSKTTGFANANYRPMNKYEDIMIFSFANASAGGKQNSMTYNPQGLQIINKKKKNTPNRQGLISQDTNNLSKNNSLLADSNYVQKYTNYPTNVIYFDNPKKYIHPTQKPIELLEYLIKTYSDENDLVLDNCMGSGSTGVACINTNRKFVGIEIEEKYFNIAKERLEKSLNEVK